MTDVLERGLGWIESPPDDRDWGVDALYAATGTEVPVELPASYHVLAPLNPVVDQGSSPMCVAYSAAGEQGWYDLRDTGLALFDEALFFRQIGGTRDGAVIRDALARRLSAARDRGGRVRADRRPGGERLRVRADCSRQGPGWGAAFGAGDRSISIGHSGRGERDSPALTQRSLGFLMVNATPRQPPAPLELVRSARCAGRPDQPSAPPTARSASSRPS